MQVLSVKMPEILTMKAEDMDDTQARMLTYADVC
jgi:hypothetical protein